MSAQSRIETLLNIISNYNNDNEDQDFANIVARSITKISNKTITYIGAFCFDCCTKLTIADFSSAKRIGLAAFDGCSSLIALILRKTDYICILDSGFSHSYDDDGNNHSCTITKGTGYIYVPRALIEDYKIAENWSAYASQFRALEDYTVDGTVTGELDETKI